MSHRSIWKGNCLAHVCLPLGYCKASNIGHDGDMRKRLITLTFVLLFVALAGIALLLVPWMLPNPEVPENTWAVFSEKLYEGDFSGAYNVLCAELRRTHDREAFIASAGGGVYAFVPYRTWAGTDPANSPGHISLDVLPVSGPEVRVVVDVVREGGKWRICSARVDP